MFEQTRKAVFLLLVFLISSQVGLHFWPKFSYVNGVRIDYLSPTLYLLDILIIVFIILSLLSLRKRKITFTIPNFLKVLAGIFILNLILNIFLAKSPGAHIFGIAKLAEFGLFGFFVAKTFSKKDIPGFVYTLCLSGIVSSVLGIWQFLQQGSIGGLWYFFGERTFGLSTIGISTVNLSSQILRAYGAFPHPNVLAFFLLTVVVLAYSRLLGERNPRLKIFLFLSISICLLALLLTFSRIIILLTVCFALGELYTKGKRNMKYVVPTLLVLPILVYSLFPQVLRPEFLFRGLNFRQELFVESLAIFQQSPYFGIGLNNFFINQSPLIKSISPIIFQPVHNIFILSLLSFGLFGFWIFPYVFVLAFRSIKDKVMTKDLEVKNFYRGVLFILCSIIIVGVFDHFFLTVEQGQVILALILGLSFTKIKP